VADGPHLHHVWQPRAAREALRLCGEERVDALHAHRGLQRTDEVRARVLISAHRNEATVHQLHHLAVYEVRNAVETLVL